MSTPRVFVGADFVVNSPLDSWLFSAVVADVYQFTNEQETIQAVATFPQPSRAWSLRWQLFREPDHTLIDEERLQPGPSDAAKARVVINAQALSRGRYTIYATLFDSSG